MNILILVKLNRINHLIGARFQYLSNYGIIGYPVRTIRFFHQLVEGMESLEGIYGLRHAPDKANYSHCELYQKKDTVSKKEKRDFRFAIKHGCTIECYPNKGIPDSTNRTELMRMFFHRIVSVLEYYFSQIISKNK